MEENQSQNTTNLEADTNTIPNTNTAPKTKKKFSPVILTITIVVILLIGIEAFLFIRIRSIQNEQNLINKLKTGVALEDNSGIVIQTPTPEEQKHNKEISDFYALVPVYQSTFHIEFNYSSNKYLVTPFGNNSSNYKEDFYKWLDNQGFKDFPSDTFEFQNN